MAAKKSQDVVAEVKANRRSRGPGKKAEPVFVTKAEIARMMSVGNTTTIDRWIADGTFPPPHSTPGRAHSVRLRRHWEIYVETGRWPKDAFPEHLR